MIPIIQRIVILSNNLSYIPLTNPMQYHCMGFLHGLKYWNKAVARVLYYAHGRKYHSLGEGGTCGVTEAARILGYSQDTVRRMIEDGELIGWRARRGGRKFLMYRAQVKDVASRAQAQAVQYARDMQQLTLPL